ncbi:MAG: DUF3810 domain-containing protein [Oscillibacter sp.]|nr:DUF3810 domain-containing protein [Oscillibacter sp.]
MTFWRTHKKKHIWLLGNAAVLGAFFLLRENRAAAEWIASRLAAPYQHAAGRLCARTDASVMEVLVLLCLAAAAIWLVWSAVAVIRARGRRASRAYGALLLAANVSLTLYALFCLLWGVYYKVPSFSERAGVQTEPVSVEDLTRTCAYFARQLEKTARTVRRDDRGVFAEDRSAILQNCEGVYREVEAEYPFLALEDSGAKAVRFSRVMSALGFTGMYCPYTGESNVNVDCPACFLPSTVAHELAHQRGVASEKECNFLAVLACTTSGKAEYVYSGWLLGYIHLGNALYAADPEAYYAVLALLPKTVIADLRNNNAYWQAFEDTTAERVSEKVYDGMLRAYGEEDGTRSYGMVVDLLVAYYKDAV